MKRRHLALGLSALSLSLVANTTYSYTMQFSHP